MAQKKKKKRIRKIIPKPPNCPFCETKTEPDYKDYKELSKYVSDRAKIIARIYSGVCSKHQRKLSQSIKRARHLGLLPFAPRN